MWESPVLAGASPHVTHPHHTSHKPLQTRPALKFLALRLSRRFYRTPIPTHRNTHRPAHSPFLTASNPRSVRPASVHTKSPRSARRGCRVPVQGSPVESRCVPLGPPSPSPPPGVRSDLSGGDPRVQP